MREQPAQKLLGSRLRGVEKALTALPDHVEQL